MEQRTRENAADTSAGKSAAKQGTRTRPFLTPYAEAVYERFKADSRRIEQRNAQSARRELTPEAKTVPEHVSACPLRSGEGTAQTMRPFLTPYAEAVYERVEAFRRKIEQRNHREVAGTGDHRP